MPSPATVILWAKEDPAFAEQYARAREIGYTHLPEEIVEISDNLSGDPARDKLRVDTRKWLLSKVLPKVYGEKLALTDPDGGPVAFTFNIDRASGDET